ncbi:hypothetical protein FRC00_003677 [Tulasnella sp. 408]|nr:hypothetical protein FRC00_003677 [Tulasnella sp. 408]
MGPDSDAARPPEVLAFVSVRDDPDHFGVVIQRVLQRENFEYGSDEPVGEQSTGRFGAAALPLKRSRGRTVYREEEECLCKRYQSLSGGRHEGGRSIWSAPATATLGVREPVSTIRLSAEHLDSFVPPVQRNHSMQGLRTDRGLRHRPMEASWQPLVVFSSPNIVIDHGTSLEVSDGRLASAPVTRDTSVNKRALRPLPNANARGGVMLSESVTVVSARPPNLMIPSSLIRRRREEERLVSWYCISCPNFYLHNEQRARVEVEDSEGPWWRRGPGRSRGVEVGADQDEEDSAEVENMEDATPPAPRVIPKAATVEPCPSPYAPGRQPVSREFPVQPFPPPYGAPLPQM